MEFFYNQETLSPLQWALRGVSSFFFLIIATKLLGERSISQLRLLDFTIALILGNILAQPLSDERLGLAGSFITATVIIILYLLAVLMSLKWNTFRKWFEPNPYPLIKNGEIIYKNLSKARISIEHLLSELRKETIEEIGHVALALWEPDGKISFFLTPQRQPLTPMDLHIVREPFSYQQTIIKEGKIDYKILMQLGKDRAWLEKKFIIYNVKENDILLATTDRSDVIRLYLYDITSR